jgi:hypothetical protein
MVPPPVVLTVPYQISMSRGWLVPTNDTAFVQVATPPPEIEVIVGEVPPGSAATTSTSPRCCGASARLVSPAPEAESRVPTAEIAVTADAGLAVTALMIGAATRPRPAAIEIINALSLRLRGARTLETDVVADAGMRFT